MSLTVYEKTLKQLNPAQKEAVEAIDGPVMVVAGPGTGKTHVLAARIAHILTVTDTPAYAILALTFTESAAVNMRTRVVQMIGKQGYYVNIMTFHAFCAEVIRTHPEYFPLERGSQPLSDLEKYEIFQQLLESERLQTLRPLNAPLFYLRDVISSISHLKREGVSIRDYEKIIKGEYTNKELSKTEQKKQDVKRSKNEELLYIYEAYQKALHERQRYDFDDMIAFVVEAFKKHELLLREYQEQIHYFLVDEYQDTNTAQNTVIDQLSSYWGQEANIFVVGDPNQSIFRFQGASMENTLGFIRTYKQAKVISLEKGYRSPQIIYDAAHAVISENKLTQGDDLRVLYDAVLTRLISDKPNGQPISVSVLPSQTLELVHIAEEIKKLLNDGVAAENIAIVYRTNAESRDLQHVLEKWHIPYEIDGGENILESEMIRQLLQVFLVIRDIRRATEDEKLFEIMSYDWMDLDPLLAMKIARAAGKAGVSIMDIIQLGYEEFMKYYKRLDVSKEEFQKADDFMRKLSTWAINDGKMTFIEWFEYFLNDSGYLDYLLLQENKIELLINLNTLFREINALVDAQHGMKLSNFLDAIITMKEHRISLDAEDLNVDKGVVHVSTAHRAKGREWEYVFLMKAIDGVWGNTRSRDLIPLPSGLLKNTNIEKKERNEDDRRLFYVVMTRPIKKLYISYPKTIINAHKSREVTGSMFIEEIPKRLKKVHEPQEVGQDAHKHILTIIQPSSQLPIRISDEAFFTDLVQNMSLSSTALTTYLRDTDEFVKNILLKVPHARKPYMAYGTAIHKALEGWNTSLQRDRSYPIEQLLRTFEEALEHELLTKDEHVRRLKTGKKVLQAYFETHKNVIGKPLFTEKFFGKGFSRTMLGDIPLTGRIDRIDLVDKQSRTVRVIDYKTGSIRSVNDIEGRTASAHLSEREMRLSESIRGSYKRQLLFYKLLTELDQTFPYTVCEGIFDFVQPSPAGQHVKRTFILKDEDVNDLKTLIRGVMQEIRSLQFLTHNTTP